MQTPENSGLSSLISSNTHYAVNDDRKSPVSSCIEKDFQEHLLSVPSDCLKPEYIYSEIRRIICSSIKIFNPVDIRTLEKLGTLQKIQTSPSTIALINLFQNAGCDVQLGYNASSSGISLTLQMKAIYFVFLRVQISDKCSLKFILR